MSSRRNTRRRTFINVEVERTDKEAVREMATDRAAELGMRVSLSDITREILRKAAEAHRAKKTANVAA